MNTCQTSVKTSILLIHLGNLHPGCIKGTRHHTVVVVPTEVNKKRVVKRTNTGLLNTYLVSF